MKIGATSWIKRGTYLENAIDLEKHVDFIELLIFSWDAEAEKDFIKQVDGLKKLNVFYTVHLPLDAVKNCEKAYSFFKKTPLDIRSFTLHPLKSWETFIKNKKDVILENLIDTFPVFERMVIDIGHLKVSGSDEAVLCDSGLQNIKEIHLHGVMAGKDHSALNKQTLEFLKKLINRYSVLEKAFKNKDLMVNFEVYDYSKLLASIRRFKAYEFAKD